jgi:hypothetical protein
MVVAELPWPLELEMMEVAIAKLPCPLEMTEVTVAKLPYSLEMTKVAIVELVAQYEEMAFVELLVDQKEWQVHVPQVMTSLFGLIVYAASVVISAHLRKICTGSTIWTD